MADGTISPSSLPEGVLADLRLEVLAAFGAKVASLTPDIRSLAADFAYGTIWPREGLSQRDRSIATIAALVVLQCTEELQLHAIRGLANGLSKEELGEILTQLIPYVGFPLVVSAATKMADLVDRATQAQE